MKTPKRIGISGSYGGMNLGDEAILHAMIRQLRDSLPVELTVFTRDPGDTRQRHGVERAIPIRDLTRDEARAEVERLDLFILGGGGILYDRDATAYLREVALAHEVGVPVVVYAISAGPLEDPSVRKLVAQQLNQAAAVTVRDRQARHLLEELGVKREVQVTADPALLLQPEPLPPDALKAEGLDPEHRLVGFSVREPGPAAPDIDVNHYHALLANAADFMVDRLDADIVFVALERQKMDLQHCHAVAAQMQCAPRAQVLKGEYTSGQMLSLVGHFQFAVGMRLHFLIFSALQGVPFVALPYASKVTGLIESLDMPMPPLKQVTTGRLIAHIDRSWDTQQALRDRIARNLPELQERARLTNRIVLQILAGGEAPGAAPSGAS
jgi:polysaccharide pyruvyl transferase CsaB